MVEFMPVRIYLFLESFSAFKFLVLKGAFHKGSVTSLYSAISLGCSSGDQSVLNPQPRPPEHYPIRERAFATVNVDGIPVCLDGFRHPPLGKSDATILKS